MQNLNVLVLEDEPLQRLVTVTALKKVMPGQVHEAASGSEALALLEHCERMDIAICDLKMPGMDGLAFLRHASQSVDARGPVGTEAAAGGRSRKPLC